MLQNAYFLAKIGADTAENERNFGEILPKNCQKLAPTVVLRRDGGARGVEGAAAVGETREVLLVVCVDLIKDTNE